MVFSFLPENERNSLSSVKKMLRIVSFNRFLGELRTPKIAFEIYILTFIIYDFKVDLSLELSTLSIDQNSSNHTVFAVTSKVTLTDSEKEAIAKKRTRTALQIQTLNRISGLPDLEPTSPISADNKINFSSRQACPERTLSKVENVRLSRSAGNKVCSGRVMKTNRIQITIHSFI